MHLRTIVFAVAVFFTSGAGAIPLSQIIVFGDSTIDPGNAQEAAPLFGEPDPAPASLGYFDGRFSNGLTYADLLNQSFGTGSFFEPAVQIMDSSLVPTGETNFGVGGANVLPPDDPVEQASGLPAQLDLFTSTFGPSIAPDELVLFNIGGNDMRDLLRDLLGGTVTESQAIATTDVVVNTLGMAIDSLVGFGAKQFMVANVPNIGLFPEARGISAAEMFGETLSTRFNDTLSDALAARVGLADFMLLNVDSLFNEVLTDGLLGNVTDPCLNLTMSPPTVCTNPDDHLFWDPIHITAAAHQLVFAEASRLLTERAVPLPGTAWLFLAGLGGIFQLRPWRERDAAY